MKIYEFELKPKIEYGEDIKIKLPFKLLKHQYEAIQKFRKNNILVVAPTASGKSEIYYICILLDWMENFGKYLLIYPTKALCNDQYKKIKSFFEIVCKMNNIKIPRVNLFTGDIDYQDRIKKLYNTDVAIMTPDVLNYHLSDIYMKKFLRFIRILVLDEVHIFKGTFGAHMKYLIKRFLTILECFNNKPKIICGSATLSNPEEFIKSFLDEDFEIIKTDITLSNRKIIVHDCTKMSKLEIYRYIENLIEGHGIVFLDSKREIEIFYRMFPKYTTYSASKTKEERENIEEKFKKGEIKVLISTNALEVGIDIGHLDFIIIPGIPIHGLMSLVQRSGRVGRGKKQGKVHILLIKNALDYYFKENPKKLEEIFRGKTENIIVPKNKIIEEKHLKRLCTELWNLNVNPPEKVKKLLKDIKGQKSLFDSIPKVNVSPPDLRIISEPIIIKYKNKILRVEEGNKIEYKVPGFMFLHDGELYIIENHENNISYAEKVYYDGFIEVLSPIKDNSVKVLNILKESHCQLCDLYVSEKYKGFIVKGTDFDFYIENHYKIEEENRIVYLYKGHSPEYSYQTRGIRFFIEDYGFEERIREKLPKREEIYELFYPENEIEYFKYLEKIEKIRKEKKLKPSEYWYLKSLGAFRQAIHGIEHGFIKMAPLFYVEDLAGISNDEGEIIIYESIPGGVGYSEVIFEKFLDILKATYNRLSNCKCLDGCSLCVFDPQCGNRNAFLSRYFAKELLKDYLSKLQ